MSVDAYGQSINIVGLADAPNAQTLAQNLGAMVPQLVMRFASASARNAAITSPVAGMVAWLTSEKLMTMYDGTAWTVMAAGASAWTSFSLATGFAHDGNGNGTAQYRLINFFGELSVQLRGGLGITYSGGVIQNLGVFTSSSVPTGARPSTLRTMTAACSVVGSDVTSLKIDAQSSGNLVVVGTQTGRIPPWVSLNGLMYSL